jgi:hypothetical protein
MKNLKYVLMISIGVFLVSIRAGWCSPTGILRAANCISALHSARNRLVGPDKPAKDLPAKVGAAPAPALAPAEMARDHSDLYGSSVEEYRGSPEGTADQGSGYGDVFDSNGHLLWRFAVLEHGNSQWTILRYSSEPTSKRRNFEPERTPQTQN